MNNLLRITKHEQLQRLVTWHEIFPKQQNESPFLETDQRYFVLFVGRDHQLLGILLQTGGCTSQPEGVVRPDAFYVDQVSHAIYVVQHIWKKYILG